MFSQLLYLFGVLFADVLQYVLASLFVWLLLDEIVQQFKRRGYIERIAFIVSSRQKTNQSPEVKDEGEIISEG